MRLCFAVVLVSASAAWAGPAAEAKAMSRRDEASWLVMQVAKGQGNPQAAISRIQFLGEEEFAANELALRLKTELEVKKRRNQAMALAQLGQPISASVLERALADEDGAVRMYAAQGLGRIGHVVDLKKLTHLLNDKTLGVRREAALALGALKDPRAGPSLMTAAKAEGEIEVRAAMLASVGRTGDKKQAGGLESFLGSDSEGTRFGAAQGLVALGNAKGYDYARKLIGSKERHERLQGLRLFEGTSAKVGAPVLASLLTDGDPAIAAVAARLLFQGGDKGKLDWLVLRSHRTTSIDEKMYFEKELEALRLRDDQRAEILARAGLK
jgi:HEAT repeat protein